MTPEAPIQIDLSQENSWDQVDSLLLTDKEKQTLSEHFSEESEWIIYLTQQELNQLKNILITQNVNLWSVPVNEAMSWELDAFIEEQTSEWISIEDLFEWNTDISAAMSEFAPEIETASQELLFWSEGLFSNLEISDTAKDHISVSLVLSIAHRWFDFLKGYIEEHGENISPEKMPEEMNNITQEMKEKFQDAKSIIDVTTPIDEWWVFYEEKKVHVQDKGEKNRIFMELQTGRAFFDSIFSGDTTGENVEEKIESQNLSEWEELNSDISGETKLLWEKFWELQGAIASLSQEQARDIVDVVTEVRNGNTTVVEEVIDDEDEWNELTGFAKIIHDLIQAIIWGLKGLSNAVERDSSTTSWRDTIQRETRQPEAEQVSGTPLQNMKNFLETKIWQWAFDGITEETLKTYFENDNDMQDLLSRMEKIPANRDENTVEEKLSNLLNTDSDGNTKLQVFIEHAWLEPIKNEDGSLNKDNFIAAITSYRSYREAEALDSGLTYRNWAENNNE